MLEPILWSAAGILAGLLGSSLGDYVQRRTKREARKSELFAVARDADHNTTPEIMVKLIYAANGRLLEVSIKKPHALAGGHWEWEHEMFIVEEGQTLSQAIAMVMLMKGLEK
jgi:hypothetical protein